MNQTAKAFVKSHAEKNPGIYLFIKPRTQSVKPLQKGNKRSNEFCRPDIVLTLAVHSFPVYCMQTVKRKDDIHENERQKVSDRVHLQLYRGCNAGILRW